MAYVLQSPFVGAQPISLLDTVGPGPTGISGIGPVGLVGGFDNFYGQETQGYDVSLGSGVFEYMRYSGTITVGTVCEITPTLTAGVMVRSATAWAGTANAGRAVCVAMATTGAVGQWGWFQIQGSAIATCQGAPVAGNPVFWQAAGIVSPTLVASKQMVNAVFATAPAVTIGAGGAAVVLSATQAIVSMNRPFAQGNIT